MQLLILPANTTRASETTRAPATFANHELQHDDRQRKSRLLAPFAHCQRPVHTSKAAPCYAKCEIDT